MTYLRSLCQISKLRWSSVTGEFLILSNSADSYKIPVIICICKCGYKICHIVTGDLKIIADSRIRSIICKGPIYSFPLPIEFKSRLEEIAGALQEFCNCWCKLEHVESNALNSWKLNIFKIIDGRISFY